MGETQDGLWPTGVAAFARRGRRALVIGRATLGRPSAGPRKRGQPAETAPRPEPKRSSPPVAFAAVLPAGNARRGQPGAGCPRAERAEAHVRLSRGRSDATCLRGRRGAVRQERPGQNAAGPIRRLGGAACSATTARRSIRPRCAAFLRAARETLRSAATCRAPVRLQ